MKFCWIRLGWKKSKAKQGEIDRQTISLSSHSPMDRLQTLARRKNKQVLRTSGFFVNIGCKFFLADLGTTTLGGFEQTKRCGWIGTNQDQVWPVLLQLLSTRSDRAALLYVLYCNFQFSSLSLGGLWSLVQNARIIWWEQLKLITDNYLLVGAIKTWSFPRETHLLFDDISASSYLVP